MHKRGQAAVFVIVGILLVFSLVLLFFFRDSVRHGFKESINKQEYLSSELNQITKEIESCAVKESAKAFRIFGENGGYFDPVDYVSYHGKKISVICENSGNKYCNAKPISKEDAEKRLNFYIQKKINGCVDLDDFRSKNYEFKTGELKTEINIGIDSVDVNVNYPIELNFENTNLKRNNFNKRINVPLGKAMNLANFIASEKAGTGDFDVISYSLLSRGDFNVREREVFPNTIYIIDFPNSEYRFNLAVEEQE